ncbi:MAG: CcmD family protein [Bacteroidetes bacterium]|nr:MAG: CcmD family protein [Bacteroidota bacterium]REK08185.1 MAG: CcmD family protein [Bacteroidota bacterium]REK32390.1 MAG: CcmD family protein [Bacteroidota bacterium]REK47442.1 MAG: CcmD family protein [Bacteroidota bacterium]
MAMLFVMIFHAQYTFSQDIDMADRMRSEGKIYVVVAVLSIIFIGILAYLLLIENKLKKLEKTQKKKS